MRTHINGYAFWKTFFKPQQFSPITSCNYQYQKVAFSQMKPWKWDSLTLRNDLSGASGSQISQLSTSNQESYPLVYIRHIRGHFCELIKQQASKIPRLSSWGVDTFPWRPHGGQHLTPHSNLYARSFQLETRQLETSGRKLPHPSHQKLLPQNFYVAIHYLCRG